MYFCTFHFAMAQFISSFYGLAKCSFSFFRFLQCLPPLCLSIILVSLPHSSFNIFYTFSLSFVHLLLCFCCSFKYFCILFLFFYNLLYHIKAALWYKIETFRQCFINEHFTTLKIDQMYINFIHFCFGIFTLCKFFTFLHCSKRLGIFRIVGLVICWMQTETWLNMFS